MGAIERIWHGSYDPEVPRSLEYPDECLPLLVERRVREFSRTAATEFFGAKLTYEGLWKEVQSLATALSRLGVSKGVKVALMLPNCPQAVIAYYGVLWLGGIVVMTNPMYVEREMEHQWNDSEAQYLIVLDHLYPKVEKVVPRTRIGCVIVTSLREYLPFHLRWLYPIKARKEGLFTKTPYGDSVLGFSHLIRQTPPSPPACAVEPEDLALLQYTGGTTGTAKGVMLSHRNIVSNVVQLSNWFPHLLRPGNERMIAVLPFFHAFGMTITMNLSLSIGATIIPIPRFIIGEFLKTLERTKPTILPGVPTIYTAIINHPDIGSYDLSSIWLCVTGSAPMPVEVLKRFESLTQSTIVEGFGLTESSPVTHVNPFLGVRKAGSIGIALPDTDCKIVDFVKGEREMELGEEGELLIKGPQVMSGYWRKDEETAEALRDGWLHTGDIAKMDEDGYVFIVDRKKDMILAGGFNVYPREIDEVLYEHPLILDAVTIGVPDPYRGETIKAFVVLKPGASLTEREVIHFCRTRLAAYKAPKAVAFCASLPKTSVGKILRKELRREEIAKLKNAGSS